MEEKIYTTEQVATMLQMHPLTILRYIKAGKLHAIRLGRVYRIRESSLKAFLNQESI